MSASTVRQKIETAKSTLQNTSAEIAMGYVLAALDEIANALEELEQKKK